MKLPTETIEQLREMILSADYDYSRIGIAEHDLSGKRLILALEDKHDFRNTPGECLQLEIPLSQFAKIIRAENLNSYEGTRLHPTKNFVYKTRIEVSKPLTWYLEDASPIEQQWAREAALKYVFDEVVNNELAGL